MIDKKNLVNYLHLSCAGMDPDIDLAEVALISAALDYGHKDLEFYRKHLTNVISKVRRFSSTFHEDSAEERARALREIIAKDYQYHGDILTYDDMQNANLMCVIDRRKGLPVTLAIIYLHVAKCLGWFAEGINFPGHFLIRLSAEGSRVIIDPFNGGISRGVHDLRFFLKHLSGGEAELLPAYFSSITNRDIIIRLMNNIKLRAVSDGNFSRAAEILERMLIVSPSKTGFLQESGIYHMRLGNLKRAKEILEEFINQAETGKVRDEAKKVLHSICAKLN